MIMPFGKYRGQELEALPESYVMWLWDNIELREPLRSGIWGRIDSMIFEHQASKTLPAVDIKAIYRELSMKWHPDHGGNTAAQQAINEFYERLRP